MSIHDHPSIWTPESISSIVYRAVMIIVSIAFIWRKYRRPARPIDEEQLIGVILPAYNTSIRRTRSANDPSQRTHQTQTRHPSTIRDVISAQIEDIIQSALGIDDYKTDIDVLRDSTASPITLAAGSSLDNVGHPVDIELGDIGLRHRSADSMVENKKGSQQGLLTDA
ncbi:hypothetical protein BGZ57DRAFT_611446 [Hyaloscypha finlandica]|nr:hypothetical protein BGZ57DRAFT_611446 [Hyaloscypha finlandica]